MQQARVAAYSHILVAVTRKDQVRFFPSFNGVIALGFTPGNVPVILPR